MPDHAPQSPTAEYILLVALVTSIGALATDIMLPALDVMGAELGAAHANDGHYIVTSFFVGMAAGQLIVGPLSDTYGRRPIIFAGYGVFVLGCVISMVTQSWSMMLAARALQGLGAAAPRVVAMALVRDAYEGRAMARILSIVMTVFILVPILAPALGQGLIYLGGWRATFGGLAAVSLGVCLWFWMRQPETLAAADRRPFRLGTIWQGILEIIGTRVALGYTLAAGLIFGMFIGYLGSAQQIFAQTFEVGDLFVLYFAIASAALGAASLVNAALVMRLGMRRLTALALGGVTALSVLFLAILLVWEGAVPLWLFLVWQLATFFCVGITFGNINALALQPLGHMAGLGAAFVGAMSTFISLPLAAFIGARYDGTVIPLVTGFAVLGGGALLVALWTNRTAGAEA